MYEHYYRNLYSYIIWEQNNWNKHLACTEFAYNNSKHSTIDITLFFANQGYYPRAVMIKETADTSIDKPAVAVYTEEMRALFETLKTTIKNTQRSRHYNKI